MIPTISNSVASVTANGIARLNIDGSIDSSFNTGTGFEGEGSDRVETIVVQSDGKILAGGYFTSYNGVTANRIVRLNSNGSRDTSFNIGAGFNMDVRAIALQSDGKIVVGGSFTSYNGVASNRIIRLNSDGTRDANFNIGTGFSFMGSSDSGIVFSLAIQNDGKILVGGYFTSYQGVSANYIIRLNNDGSRDTSFNIGTGFDNTVNSIAIQNDGKILVVGGFTSYKGVPTNYIARLNNDGSLDTSFNTGTSLDYDYVHSLDIQNDGKIIVGGDFTSYNGEEANSLIRLNSDGSRDTSFNLAPNLGCTIIYDVVIASDGKLLLGGQLYNNQTGNYQACLSRLNSNGSKDTSFNVGTGFNTSDSSVYSLTLQSDGKIIVGGKFSAYQGVLSNNIVRLNSDGSRDSSINYGSGFNDFINSLKLQSDGKILVSGAFGQYNGQTAGYITRLSN